VGEPYASLQDKMPPGVGELTPELVFNGRWNPEARLAEIKVQIAIHEIRSIVP
jgi:hypothetical protein